MMTNVNIDNINGTTVVSVSGHAGYSSQGDDIVCAALSTITQSFLETLKCYQKESKCIVLKENVSDKLGYCSFSFKGISPEIKGVIDMAVIGYQMMANTYPEYVFFKTPSKGRN